MQQITFDDGRSRTLARTTTARRPARALSGGLGWFSIGLGLAEVLAPATVARTIGLIPNRNLQRTLMAAGLRELATGFGILASRRRAPWLWARVAGDLLDLGILGASTRHLRLGGGKQLAMAVGAVGGVMLLDASSAKQHSSGGSAAIEVDSDEFEDYAQPVTELITINKPVDEVYRFFRNFENLPRFMAHLDSVEVRDDGRSRWRVIGPMGKRVEWEAEISDERPNQLIAWRSLPGADIDNSGVVHFSPAPGGRGTELRVDIRYAAPGGKLGSLVAKLMGKEPGQQAKSDLRRLKQVLEVGEVVHSDASIHRGMHPAQPSQEFVR